MSARYGSLPGVENCYGTPGLGVLGSVIRADTANGAFGAGYLYNDLTAADDAKEIRGLVVTPPASGTLFAYEDGSFDFTAPADGSYTFTYRLFADGADLGTAAASFTVGAGSGGGSTATITAAGAIASALVIGLASISAVFEPGSTVATVTAAGAIGSAQAMGVPTATATFPSSGGEPVTVPEAKLAARLELDDTAFDGLVAGFITAAREQAEQVTGRLYREATVRIELTDWPSSTYRLNVHAPRSVAIQWWDGAAWQLLDGTLFAFAALDASTVIAPALGAGWPQLGQVAIGPRVRIDITAGPTSSSQVPEQVKLYIKALVSFWVNRPDAGQVGPLQTNPHFDRLLDRERLWH